MYVSIHKYIYFKTNATVLNIRKRTTISSAHILSVANKFWLFFWKFKCAHHATVPWNQNVNKAHTKRMKQLNEPLCRSCKTTVYLPGIWSPFINLNFLTAKNSILHILISVIVAKKAKKIERNIFSASGVRHTLYRKWHGR